MEGDLSSDAGFFLIKEFMQANLALINFSVTHLRQMILASFRYLEH